MLKTQIIDISRSAIITDPESFYENLMSTGQEDAPEKTMPIVAYEGYNFLPTVYGYRSYFDIASKVDIQALSSKCDKLINFQLSDYSNFLIALTEDGIYTNPGKVSNAAWTLAVGKTAPGVGQYKEWTYCVIENKLYMYRQGDSTAHVKSNVPGSSITTLAPSFLNMSGQMGIFRANGRLGFWDSANSISWSSVFDLTDFTPSIETLAGDVIFNDVLGRIISIKASGSGFVIYTTKNIVGAAYSTGGSILFAAHTIAETAGIWSSKQVCTGVMDTEHFAYTNTGIKHVSNAEKVDNVFAPVYDFLKEARDPVYLDFLQGRYLFINVINPAYIDGYVTFAQVDVPTYTVRLLYNGGEYTPTPPTNIQGVPLDDALVNSIVNGFRSGLYAQWNASGSKLIPSRTPSPMNPYQIDDPFTPEDDYPYAGNGNPLYSSTEILDARDNGTWTNKFSIDNSVPFALVLGWHNAPLGTGHIDSELTRMKARQLYEWNEYWTMVQSFLRMVSSAGTSTTYADVNSPLHPFGYSIPTNSTNVTTEIGVVINSDTAPATETFTGVGSYSPAYEYSNTYNKEFPIQQNIQGSSSATDAFYTISYQYQEYSNVASFGKSSTSVGVTGSADFNLVTGSGGTVTYDDTNLPILYQSNGITATRVTWDALVANFLTMFPAVSTITYAGITRPVIDVQHDSQFNVYPTDPPINPKNFTISARYSITYLTAGFYAGSVWTYSRITHAIETHQATIERRSTSKTLVVGVSRSRSPLVSKLTATQEILDWAIYTIEAPPAGFNWPTNQRVVGSDIPFLLSPALPPLAGVTYPGATFLLQDAIPAAIFPDFAGSLVYDTYLQKWGKMKATFRALLDYSPLNSNNNGSIPYSNFGLDAGILDSSGFVKLFSARCTDTKIRYGKFAMSRQGFTSLEYVDIKFRKPFTGTIILDTSLDGRSLHTALSQSSSFVGVGLVTVTPDYSGRWFVITIIGEFDLRSIEFTGRPAGIR